MTNSGRVALSWASIGIIVTIGIGILGGFIALTVPYYNALDTRINRIQDKLQEIELGKAKATGEDDKPGDPKISTESPQLREFVRFQNKCRNARGAFSNNLKTCIYPDGHRERFDFK